MRLIVVRERVLQAVSHPVTFLLAINIACAVLGGAQFVYTLTALKPADFAVIGVLAAVAGVVTGLLDVRLADLTTKVFYAVPKAEPRRRGSLLAASFALHAAAGLVSAALVFGAACLLAQSFLAAPPEIWWSAAMALRFGTAYPMSALTTFPRLLGNFQASGWLRLMTQFATTSITIVALTVSPDLTGYFAGVTIGAIVTLAMALGTVGPQIKRSLASSILQLPPGDSLRPFLASGSFLAGASLGGLGKLLSRSGDVLLMAALTNDTVTGLYRIARQGFDTLAGLTDALQQFYTPTLVDCVAKGEWTQFKRHRTQLFVLGLIATTTVLLATGLILQPLAIAYYPQHLGAVSAFMLLAGMLFISIGVQSWLWPQLVSTGRVTQFGILGTIGAIAQLATMSLLAWCGWLTPETAAIAAWLRPMLMNGVPAVTSRRQFRQRQ